MNRPGKSRIDKHWRLTDQLCNFYGLIAQVLHTIKRAYVIVKYSTELTKQMAGVALTPAI